MDAVTFAAPILRHAFDMRAVAGAPITFGTRRIIPIRGGIVTGPRLQGRLLDAGADFQTLLDDVTEIDARHLIEAHDGAVIELRNQGVRKGTPENHRMHTLARLETHDPRYTWMNATVFIAHGKRLPEGVNLSFYEVT